MVRDDINKKDVAWGKNYEKKFRKRPTSTLISGYKRYSADFRAIARDEFKKRKVPTSKLPYKKRSVNSGTTTKRKTGFESFGLGGGFF